MKILYTAIKDLLVIEREPKGDSRGYFERLFCEVELKEQLKNRRIEQINHTLTKNKGTLRGMHFQYPPHDEAKIVSCLQGEVFDVAVDLRFGSPTFLHWYSVTLSEENFRSFYIPYGFTHGFQTLTDNCQMLYFHTEKYHAGSEGGISYKEPRIGINWPLPVTEISERDKQHALLEQEFAGLKNAL